MHGAHELEAEGVIRRLVRRLGGRAAGGDDTRELAALRSEVERLRGQNESMKRAMRQCVDCEYRVEVMAQRAARGLTADGSASASGEGPTRAEPREV